MSTVLTESECGTEASWALFNELRAKLIAAGMPDDLARWNAARATFEKFPEQHLFNVNTWRKTP